MAACERVRELLSAALDGELPADAAAAVESHLGVCPACREEHHHIARVRSLVRALPARQAPDPVQDALRSAAHVRDAGARARQLAAATALLVAVLMGGALGAVASEESTTPVPVDALVTEHLTVSGPTAGSVSADR